MKYEWSTVQYSTVQYSTVQNKQSWKLLCWILKIPNDWSRNPLCALLIWGSMLNLYISVIPSGYNYTTDIK